jgi:predicted kinase
LADNSLTLAFPRTSLIVLCGPAGSGKSTFAKRHFAPSQIVSSDQCRLIVADDEANQVASKDAFELLYTIVDKRLKFGRLTIVDSTALTKRARDTLRRLGRQHDFAVHLIVFDIPEQTAVEWNMHRERHVPLSVLQRQYRKLREVLRSVHTEGWDRVWILHQPDLERVRICIYRYPVEVLQPGPFDIIGDVHGCIAELTELLDRLGYVVTDGVHRHPEGRIAVFIGDLVDRGPDSIGVVRLVDSMVQAKSALLILGNHDEKFLRYLQGHHVEIKHGLQRTVAQFTALSPDEQVVFAARTCALFRRALPYIVLDNWRLVVTHAGIKERMIGRLSRRIIRFCLYGDPTGEYTADGRPIRRDWAQDYHGKALIVYGHTPVPEPEFRNNTVNIDQGCVFGGQLTALRYPERTFVQIPSRQPRDERRLGGEAIAVSLPESGRS